MLLPLPCEGLYRVVLSLLESGVFGGKKVKFQNSFSGPAPVIVFLTVFSFLMALIDF